MPRPTLADLLAEIADDLDRPDLGPQIARAVAHAVRHFAAERFAFNEGAFTFQTIPGADVYAAGDGQAIPDLYAVDSAVLVLPDGSTSVLDRIPESAIEAVDQPASTAQPCAFSYFARTLRLWPVPSVAWTVRVSGHLRLDLPDDPTVANAWTDEAADLVACRAKWRLALHVLRDDDLAQRMAAAGAEAYARLKATANGMASSGVVAAYDL